MVRSHLVGVGRAVGSAVLCLAAVGISAPVAAADPAGSASPLPDPAAAQLSPAVPGEVGGSAGLYAVGGGLVVVAGGAAMWVRRSRASKVTIH